MTSVKRRLADMERRLAAAEDQLAIYRLLMAYGPAADSGSDDVVLALHHQDAEYDSQMQAFHGGKADAVCDGWLPDGSDASHRHMRAGRSAAGAVPGTEPGR
jgi:hypothetical protein